MLFATTKTPAEAQRDASQTISEARYAVRVMSSAAGKNSQQFNAALKDAQKALEILAKFL